MATAEQLIKHGKFKNEKHKAVVCVVCANNLINNHYEEFFKRFNLTIQQYNALRILRGLHPKPSTVNLIRERMLDKMSDASRIVERLRKAGLVERVVSAKDRRAVDVIITKEGLGILSEIDKLEDEMYRPTDKLSDEEAGQLNRLLEKVLESMAQ
jgi:MarR family multiple gene transcriptional regulator MgrA